MRSFYSSYFCTLEIKFRFKLIIDFEAYCRHHKSFIFFFFFKDERQI